MSKGVWWHRRRAVAYVLMVIFVVVPYIRMAGKPLIQLDITARKFTIFGYTFLPTDTLLLALAMLGAFIAIVFVTAITGRAWCGWACPQTVYMEYLFRPIDRLFEGTGGKGEAQAADVRAASNCANGRLHFTEHVLSTHFFGLFRWHRKTSGMGS
ncbi:MAG: 4Fe-4S binding protein [Pirellulaceae bacterium]